MKQLARLRVFVLACFSVLIIGCGSIASQTHLNAASRALERARSAGAEDVAPYAFYFAKAHLEKAREEASRARYQDAREHARVAEDYATRAYDASRVDTVAP